MKDAVKQISTNFNKFILDPILYLLVIISVLMFFWGLAQFMLNGNDGDRKDGKNHMLWGIIGLVVIFSSWGIINLIQDTLTTISTI